MQNFPSRYLVQYGIIRMHGYKTCEISLLWFSDLSIRSSKTSMFNMQANLVNSSEKTWKTKTSNAIGRFETSLSRKIWCQSPGQAQVFNSTGHISLSISASPQSLCCASKPAKTTIRSAHSFGRRALVPLREKTLDSASYGTQILQRKNGRFSRSGSSIRQRRQNRLATSLCNDSAWAQNPYLRSRCRQSQRHEENCQTRRMGSAALSLSPHSEISNPVPSSNTQAQRRSRTRRNLSAYPSSSRNYEQNHLRCVGSSVNTPYTNFVWYSAYSSCCSGLPYFNQILPDIFDISRIKPTEHYQYGRVNGIHHPGFTTTQSLGFQFTFCSAMGNCVGLIASEIGVQRQTFSTELINSTPDWHLKENR